MKRIAFILLCLVCAAGGLALGRYVWAAPVPDAPVTRPSSILPPQKAATASVQDSLAALRSGPRRAALILSLAARGEKRHLPALIEACAHDEAALQFLGETWLHIDPGAFIKALAASKSLRGSQREQCAEALLNVLERWGEEAPDAAWQSVESLTGTMRRVSLSKLAGRRLMADARAGLEFLKSHPGVSPQMVPSFTSAKERAELLPLITALPECPSKTALLRQAVKELPLTEAMQHLSASADDVASMARYSVLYQAAARSVDEVIAFHATATGADRYAAARAAGEALMTKDPSAAITWAEEHLSGPTRTAVLKKAAVNLQSKNPAAAEAARALLPGNHEEQ